jgi:hypothetical protein
MARAHLKDGRIVLPNGIGMGQFAPSKGTKCERTVLSWLRAEGLRIHANRRTQARLVSLLRAPFPRTVRI